MYLRDLSVGASHSASPLTEQKQREFGFSAYHVQEIVLSFMPNKYELDGMGKTNLYLGPRGDKPQYQQLINVNAYYLEEFDFDGYFASTEREREETILNAIESSLADIARRFDADPTPIHQAADSTRKCGFCRKYVIKRLCRSTRSRKLRLNVFREVRHGGERWGIDFTNRSGDVVQTRWITESTYRWESAYDYRSSVWKEDCFVILD
ncbi:MAG TPA: hypothetical protein P5307_30090, partial [Pirellulaceae bacterium]|nr:hypothetical protein [Pirellulaceae bacterium]